MPSLFFLILPFGMSVLLCRLLISVSVRDAPDGERKLQPAPVPTAGGLAMLAAIAIPLLALGLATGATPLTILTGLLAHQPHGSWVLFVLGLGLLGVLDDGFGLPAWVKLVLLAGACLAMATQMPAVDLALPPGLGSGEAEATGLQVPMLAGLALWLFVCINATNFMDGADGLAMGCLAIMLAGLGVGLASVYWPMLDFIDTRTWALLLSPVIAIMAIAGFLVWNLRGRLYAGDTGALALGGLLAVISGYAAAHLGIWFPLVLALPFLVDVGMTLAHRAVRRQPLLRAHRDHAYQLLIRRGAAPVRVALLWWGLTFVCLLGALSILWLEPVHPGYGAMLFAALALLGATAWMIQRGLLHGRSPASRSGPQRPSISERSTDLPVPTGTTPAAE